ncbi:NlpC/P60 family protein [Polymorphospora sp. NPDC050346]|uniref:C40 family peptidase n=1 Tax=Polymorphospora sp. NPDC050346 TaxID=3155780 RepID=UPI0033FCF7FA
MLLRAVVLTGITIGLVVPATGAAAEPSVSELTQRINKSSTELEKVVESYNKLNEEIKATKAAKTAVEAKLGPLQEQLAQTEVEVGTIAARAYKSGGLDTIQAILTASENGSLVDRLGTLEQLARERQSQVSGFTATQREYLDEQARLDATLARETAQAKELQAGKKKIEADLKKLYEMRERAYGAATNPGSSYSGSIPAVSGQAGVAVRFAYGAIGKPYVWAASGPNGYDCSGLTLAAWRAAGKSLPHNAAMQWDRVAKISRSALQPGDLVFYSNLGHVGIFVGSGKVIHAPTFGESVKISSVDMMPPYGYGRVR